MSASGARSEYQRLERIGRGSFATVYRAVHLASNREVAIKDISQDKLTHKLQENLESEISILKNHSHRNIVKLYAIERNERHIYIILEYCRGGDLQRFIKAQPAPSRLDEATARHFMRHLAAGLKFLNDRNLVHRDIKPQNLLLTENSAGATLKIADFGFARHLEGTSMADTLCGSPLYMAPEILSQNQYNAKADLWSVGAVLFEMVVGRPPFSAQNQMELLRVIKRPLEIPVEVKLSAPCVGLLQGLLKREPLERVSFEDFFQDPWLLLQDASSGVTGGVAHTPALVSEPLDFHREPQQEKEKEEACSDQDQDQDQRRSGSTSTSVGNCLEESSPSCSSSLPFQPGPPPSASASATPSPRVNPFKPLAASPPGAVALLALGAVGPGTTGSARLSSTSSSCSVRGRAGGCASAGVAQGGVLGAGGTGAAMGLGMGMGMAGSGSGGADGGVSGSSESDGFVIVEPQQASGAGSSSSGSGTTTQGHGRRSPSGAGQGQGQASIDSLEGALRVLTYVENSTRRATLVASLGDAKAIAGLDALYRLQRGNGEDSADPVPFSGREALPAGSDSAKTLLLDALVLYLKALNVVGTAIKALRQVMDVIQAHSVRPAWSTPGRGGAGAGLGQEERSDSGPSLRAVYGRITSLREWLEQHFAAILERAEECQTQVGEGEGHNSPTGSAEELLYRHALTLAREGAVKELLGQAAQALELYLQARLTMESLLAEPLLPPEDQCTLEAYVRDFGRRAEELEVLVAAAGP